MKKKMSEVEKLQIRYELLQAENQALKEELVFVKSSQESYRKMAIEGIEVRFSLLRKIIEQRRFIGQVVTINAGYLGLYDVTSGIYHQIYQN